MAKKFRSSRKGNFEFLYFKLIFTTDRDQTVSQRSEPSSSTTLIDEQSNPSYFLLQEDVISRHRGAKLFH